MYGGGDLIKESRMRLLLQPKTNFSHWPPFAVCNPPMYRAVENIIKVVQFAVLAGTEEILQNQRVYFFLFALFVLYRYKI